MIKTSSLLFVLFLLFSTVLGTSLSSTQMRTPAKQDWEAPSIIFPADNPGSEASIELGGALFFETLFSRDSSISCQSCHLLTQAFADHLPLGEGIRGRTVTRNTPSLINIGQHPYFMADGKFGSLEDQVLGPINEHREFDMTPEEVVSRLKTVPLYNELSMKAYGQELNIDVIQKALANFERAIVSQDSRFDQFMKDEIELTPEEKAGWKLFNNSELNCIQCHGGYNFTNYTFENNGLYANPADSGRALITGLNDDIAKFKVPSLRNVSITYPYMHDGSVQSLAAIIDHYASGGQNYKTQSKLIRGFKITKEEKMALVAFLKTLTDNRYLEE
jgi:cytochrome c peroxidase